MATRGDVLARLESLVERLDPDAFELAVETRGGSRRVRARPTPARDGGDTDERAGREKFATRRKVRRLDRLLKRAGREGVEPAALVEPAEPRLRTVTDEETATVFVDRPAAEARPGDDGSTLVVETGGATVTAALPFEAVAVDREKRAGFTAFRVRGESSGVADDRDDGPA